MLRDVGVEEQPLSRTHTFYKSGKNGDYEDARRYWLTLKRLHRQHVFNVPMATLEREAATTDVASDRTSTNSVTRHP